MTEPAALTTQEKIQILLKEYDTLRAELITRNSGGYYLAAAAGAALTWLLGRPIDARFWVALIVIGVISLGIAYLYFRDMARAGRQVQVLEHRINELAGDNLLQWETQHAGVATDEFLGRFHRGPIAATVAPAVAAAKEGTAAPTGRIPASLDGDVSPATSPPTTT